ncbi:MAG TPA: hypothetical protein PK230_01535 [Chitinophagales bacterium]|nr:hypothetical protein [Chitinophagales bacterium]
MGWKLSAIIIQNPSSINHEELLHNLGYEQLTRIEDEYFEVAKYRYKNEVYIGTYKNNLIICNSDIVWDFWKQEEQMAEKILKRLFPNSEICAVGLLSTVNFWGFSVINNGQRIRVRAGGGDNERNHIEIGLPLEEEKKLLNQSLIDENGERVYFLNDDNNPSSEDQVGELFVFAICERYFGVPLDHDDTLMFETKLAGYSYHKKEKSESNQIPPLINILKGIGLITELILKVAIAKLLKKTKTMPQKEE